MTETLNRAKLGGAPAVGSEWSICRGCGAMIYVKRLIRNLKVCPDCGWHGSLTAAERLDQLLDRESGRVLDFPVPAGDPLGFADSRPYTARLREARERTGLAEAVLCARGTVLGNPVVVAVMDFRFLGGSLGAAVGELITRAAETALQEGTPLILVTASGGARMQEGAISLMQMAKTGQALGRLGDAGVLTVSLVTDPTFGGVAASFATLGDIIIAEPGARMGFAGPRVIAQTIGQALPSGFQTAEFLMEHGIVDIICARAGLRPALARLLSAASPHARRPERPQPAPRRRGQLAPEPVVVRDPDLLSADDAWSVVRQARNLTRPTTLDYIGRLIDDFEELHGDRLYRDCPAVVGGIGRLGSTALVVIGHQKGHALAELTARNYAMPTPSGYRKAARLMRLAARLKLPVVTLIDTPGAYPGISAEEQGQAVAIAENLRLMATLPVPIVAVVTGEGGSGGALAFAVADQVLMFEHAVYSVISPEGCASILWKDASAAPSAAAALGLDARTLLRLGVIDGVVLEPDGGAETDHGAAADRLRTALETELPALACRAPADLVADRQARFRRFGAPGANS